MKPRIPSDVPGVQNLSSLAGEVDFVREIAALCLAGAADFHHGLCKVEAFVKITIREN